jgi:negative regulator of flagellin synthesis FlgM
VASKINGLSSRPVAISPGTGIAKTTQDNPAPQQQPAAGTSDVQITGTARNLAALEQQIRDLPAVNPTNVAAVRQSLADGSYQIDPQRIADKLLGLERALGNEKK